MNAKKVLLIVVGVLVALLIIVGVAGYLIFGAVFGFFQDKAQEATQNIPTEQITQTSSPDQQEQTSTQESSATGEIVGEMEKADIPIPEFSVMEEVMSEKKKGENFKVMYSINRPEEGAVKDFYENNLSEDWSLDKQQTVSGQTMYSFTKGDNYELDVVVMGAGMAPSMNAMNAEGNTALVLEYSAPYQEDPYPNAVNVTPTSETGEKYNDDMMAVFESVFGGSKLVDAGSGGDATSLDYVVKRPITQEDATRIRQNLEEKGYNTTDVSKTKNEASYDFKKTYGEKTNVNMEINVGEFVGDTQKIEVNAWP